MFNLSPQLGCVDVLDRLVVNLDMGDCLITSHCRIADAFHRVPVPNRCQLDKIDLDSVHQRTSSIELLSNWTDDVNCTSLGCSPFRFLSMNLCAVNCTSQI